MKFDIFVLIQEDKILLAYYLQYTNSIAFLRFLKLEFLKQFLYNQSHYDYIVI